MVAQIFVANNLLSYIAFEGEEPTGVTKVNVWMDALFVIPDVELL